MMYFHGGGMIIFDADTTKHNAARMAVDGDMPVFVVDFKSAPELKCPDFVL